TCTTIIAALSDAWIEPAQQPIYIDLLNRHFRNFFFQYVDQEDGSLRLSDNERGLPENASMARVNFAVAHQLSLWCHYAGTLKEPFQCQKAQQLPSGSRFFSFSSGGKREQGLLVHRDEESGLAMQLPLVDGNSTESCAFLAYPHCSGIFEAPVQGYWPILVPELQIDGKLFTPSFYGKAIGAGIGSNREFQWHYEQPDLIDIEGHIHTGIASCKVQWNFQKTNVHAEFTYIPKKSLQLERFRYVVAIAMPHSQTMQDGIPQLDSAGGPWIKILQDDFLGDWQQPQDVSADQAMRTHSGKIHYLLAYIRMQPVSLQSGRNYRFSVALTPNVKVF
ncbi:MAG: hypothetical protein LBC42_01505, partial [Puniceicoccales bacterium]|nr:hypothetical protein [Puniceicoccales bacterium]